MPKTYRGKRTFETTPEPVPEIEGDVDPGAARPGSSFVIQQHYATRLHHDLRLEMMNGDVPVLVSWAVPRGLPLEKGESHLAVHVEDHPFDYGSFEGTIPKGNYGAGEVRIFDRGSYELLEQAPGKLSFRLHGERLKGVWHLNRTTRSEGKDEWLAFLKTDERSDRDPVPDLKPMLATIEREAFDDEGWMFEPKWDGVRTLAICDPGTTRLLSRKQHDVTATYPELERLHDRLVAIDAVIDGEIVAFEKGRPSFEKLQSRINLQNPRDISRAVKSCPVTFIAFDVLYVDGRNVVGLPVEERKELLERLIVASDKLHVSPWVIGEGRALADVSRQRNLEGIVAKRLGCPYRPGRRSRDWLKVKVVHTADVVVGGWSPGEGARSSSFGALLVGAYEGGRLRFMGSVGTGFTDAEIARLLPELHARQNDACPFDDDPTGTGSRFGKPLKNPRWMAPELVARIEFRELTSQGRLRAPSYKGIRSDIDPQDCSFEEIAREVAP